MNIEIEKLIAARALIEDPLHWCQGALACRADGSAVPTRSPEAVCWCMVGACWAVEANEAPLSQTPGVVELMRYNDTRTHQDVLDLFDFAINRLMNP